MILDERDRAIVSHMSIVNKVTAQECGKLCADATLREEIRSFAMEGLHAALTSFDEQKGIAFQYYAQQRIRWSIYNGLRRIGWLPKNTYRKLKFLSFADETLREHAKSPAPNGPKEAAHRLSDRLKELATGYFITCVAETDQISSVEPEAETSLLKKEAHGQLMDQIKTLPEQERKIVVDHFFRNKKLVEIANELQVSPSWVSRILARALSRIRTLLNENPELLSALREPNSS